MTEGVQTTALHAVSGSGGGVRRAGRLRRIIGQVATVAAILTGLAFTWGEYEFTMFRARDRLVGVSDIVETKFGAVEFGDIGEGEPLLMIHGSGGGFDQGIQFSRRLIDDGFRVVAPSRFGYLRSSLPVEASSTAQADAFVAVLDHLGLGRVPVVAGSAGALSAVQFAIRHPDRCSALVLLVPLGYVPDRSTDEAPSTYVQTVAESSLRSDFAFWTLLKVAPDFLTSTLLATDPSLLRTASPDERQRVERILVNILPVSSRADGVINDGRLARALEPVDLSLIKAPVLVMSLPDDRYGTLATAEYIADNVPDGRLLVYPSGGHVWVGHDADVFAEVAAFVHQETNAER